MVGLIINSMLSGMFIRNGAELTSYRNNKLDNADDDVFDDGNAIVRLSLHSCSSVAFSRLAPIVRSSI